MTLSSDLRITRRQALGWAAAGTLGLGLNRSLRAASRDPQGRRIPIGVQLYSVRTDCAKDFDATLAKVAEIGFEGVEFAGYYKYSKDPEGLRKKLDQLGLKAAGTHVGAGSLVGDALKQTVAFHKTIGCRFLICPGDRRFTDPEKSKEFAELMNRAAEALREEGLFCGYHNHVDEFTKKDGDKNYWDLFAERTSKEVLLQLDVGHARFAGLDPAEVARKHPGRTKSTHMKGRLPRGAEGKKPFIGQDTIDWKALISACYEVAGTEWFVVEQEDYPDGLSPMECTRISFEGLTKILKEMGK